MDWVNIGATAFGTAYGNQVVENMNNISQRPQVSAISAAKDEPTFMAEPLMSPAPKGFGGPSLLDQVLSAPPQQATVAAETNLTVTNPSIEEQQSGGGQVIDWALDDGIYKAALDTGYFDKPADWPELDYQSILQTLTYTPTAQSSFLDKVIDNPLSAVKFGFGSVAGVFQSIGDGIIDLAKTSVSGYALIAGELFPEIKDSGFYQWSQNTASNFSNGVVSLATTNPLTTGGNIFNGLASDFNSGIDRYIAGDDAFLSGAQTGHAVGDGGQLVLGVYGASKGLIKLSKYGISKFNSGPGKNIEWVALSDIKSTQATVFIKTGDGTPVLNVASDMKLNGWDLSKGGLDLIRHDDGFMALDHRRLVAADWAGLDKVPGNIHGFDELLPNSFKQSGRYQWFESPVEFSDVSTRTTFYKGDLPETWGQAGMIRSLQQQERFGQFPISGSSDLPLFTFKGANDWAEYINQLERLQSR